MVATTQTRGMTKEGDEAGLFASNTFRPKPRLSLREQQLLDTAARLVFQAETSLGRNPIGRKAVFRYDVIELFRLLRSIEQEAARGNH